MTRADEIRPALESICLLLWAVGEAQPEIAALVERRGSAGYPHYITSRAGLLPDSEWAQALFVLPPSLVDHLRPRCLDLDPGQYLEATLGAAGMALRRLHPEPIPLGLGLLARAITTEGGLPSAFSSRERSGDHWSDALGDAMVLREARALGHYRAALAQGLSPVELLELSYAAAGRTGPGSPSFFRWDQDHLQQARLSLRSRSLLNDQLELTGPGWELRQLIEEQTELAAEASISGLEPRAREEALGQLARFRLA